MEPTDLEVNEAIDRLAEQAKKSFHGTTGNAWGARMEIQRQADRLKAMLNAKRSDTGNGDIQRRCRTTAERFEQLAGPARVEASVSADLMLEAAALLRGYGQCLMIEEHLAARPVDCAKSRLVAVLHQMEHGEASDSIDRRDEDVGSWKDSSDDLRWCREQLREALKEIS